MVRTGIQVHPGRGVQVCEDGVVRVRGVCDGRISHWWNLGDSPVKLKEVEQTDINGVGILRCELRDSAQNRSPS